MSCDKICNTEACPLDFILYLIYYSVFLSLKIKDKKQETNHLDALFQPLSSDILRHQLILHVLIKYLKFPVFAFALTSGMVKLSLIDSVCDSHLAGRL